MNEKEKIINKIRGAKGVVENFAFGGFMELHKTGQTFFEFGISKVKETVEIVGNMIPENGTFSKFNYFPAINAEEERRS